jgi:hypothetical protein
MFHAAARVDGHLQPRAQQHNPHWQQTSLSTNDSQHVSGGTPALKQQRLTQQQSSPLQDAPQHLRRFFVARRRRRIDGVGASASRGAPVHLPRCVTADVVAAELTSDAAARLRKIRVERGVAAKTAID